MFKHVASIIFPFNAVCKLNLKSSYVFGGFFYSAINLSDTKQKEDFSRTIPLSYTSLTTSGFFPIYTKVSKSVSNFKTRENDLIGASTILKFYDYMSIFENALESEIYLYFETLYRSRFNFSSNSILSIGFPDFRYLPKFKASPLHTLNYAFGYDFNMYPIKSYEKALKTTHLYLLFFSSLYILPQNFNDD